MKATDMKIASRIIWTTVVILACGCATRGTVSETPNVYIGVGTLIHPNQPSDYSTTGDMSMSTYQVLHLRGEQFFTNVVHLHYYTSSLPSNGLPSHAIVIAQHPLHLTAKEDKTHSSFVNQGWPRRFYALGQDAYRGILPDCPENRTWVLSVPLNRLAQNPTSKRISERRAHRIARSYCYRKGFIPHTVQLQFTGIRYSHGWRLRADDATQHDRSPPYKIVESVTVGDDGVVKSCSVGVVGRSIEVDILRPTTK